MEKFGLVEAETGFTASQRPIIPVFESRRRNRAHDIRFIARIQICKAETSNFQSSRRLVEASRRASSRRGVFKSFGGLVLLAFLIFKDHSS